MAEMKVKEIEGVANRTEVCRKYGIVEYPRLLTGGSVQTISTRIFVRVLKTSGTR